MAKKNIPVWIKIISVLFFLEALIILKNYLYLFVFYNNIGTIIPITSTLFFDFIILVLSVIAGIGLWKYKRYGRIIGITTLSLLLINQVYGIINILSSPDIFLNNIGVYLFSWIVSLAIYLIIIFYLLWRKEQKI